MHVGSCGRGAQAVVLPRAPDVVGGLSEVLVLRVAEGPAAGHDFSDDLGLVELLEVRVVPGGDGGVVGLPVHGVGVRGLVEGDVRVAGVGVGNFQHSFTKILYLLIYITDLLTFHIISHLFCKANKTLNGRFFL